MLVRLKEEEEEEGKLVKRFQGKRERERIRHCVCLRLYLVFSESN